MDVIFTILLQIWLFKKCVYIPRNIMGHHTGNVYDAVVRNVPVLVYLTRIKIKIQKSCVKQYVLMFAAIYHFVLFMSYSHMQN